MMLMLFLWSGGRAGRHSSAGGESWVCRHREPQESDVKQGWTCQRDETAS